MVRWDSDTHDDQPRGSAETAENAAAALEIIGQHMTNLDQTLGHLLTLIRAVDFRLKYQTIMMNFDQLCTHLAVDACRLRELIDAGLPCDSDTFDLVVVDEWLIDHGLADRVEEEQIARTYGELAIALGMNQTDIPNISRWAKEPSFPGRPGSPGRRDAYLPVEQIKAWRESMRRQSETGLHDPEMLRLYIQRERLRLEREIREQLRDAERFASVDQVDTFNRAVVEIATRHLATIPEQLDALLSRQPRTQKAFTRWRNG